jgi:WD40 repeat protein/tetratricopeptide (TPR) repeat protein
VARRGLEPRKLSALLRGELDWVVMKALEKDRNRRYETANGFAQDIQRYLADEPVQACPPSARYRLQKFLRRNKRLVLAVTVILVLLCGGIIGTTLGLLQAQRSEEHAQQEARQAGQERDQANAARGAADQARKAEEIQRKLVEERGKELRWNLYVAEMNQGGRTAQSNSGFARTDELLSHWKEGRPDLRGWEWYYLFGRCHQDQLTIPVQPAGHTPSVVWSPGGTRLATSNRRGRPQIWNAVTGEEAVILAWDDRRGSLFSSSVAWSPDGALLASDWGFEILLWDAVTGEERGLLKGHRNPVRSLAWASDGIHLVSGSMDQTVTVWDARTGKATLVLKGHSAVVTSVAWSRDGKRLASADFSGTIKIWDGNTGKEIVTFGDASGRTITSIAWSPDDKRLASICAGSSGVTIWDPDTAKQLRRVDIVGGSPLFVSWSPNGTRLAVADGLGFVRVVALGTGTDTPKVVATLTGHSDMVGAVTWSPDGTRLASAGADGSVKVWQADQRDQPLVLPQPKNFVQTVAWSPSGKRLASTGCNYTIDVWDPATGDAILTLGGHTGTVLAFSWNPAGTRLASASRDATIKVWDVATGKELRTLKALNSYTGRAHDLFAVSWSPDGTRLASADSYGVVRIWDPVTGESSELFDPKKSSDPSNWVSWSPDSTRIACACNSGKVRILDRATGKSTILSAHELGVNSVAWCPKGTRLASAGRDRTIKIWDATTGEKLVTCKGHTSLVTSVAWNPDGTRLASAGGDCFKIWEPATGTELLSLPPLFGGAGSVDWSPDGLRLAAGDGHGTLVFDAAGGYRRAGDAERAIERTRDSTTMSLLALSSRPEVPAHLGQWDRAVEDYKKLIQVNPDDHAAFLGLGRALLRQKGKVATDEVAACREVIEAFPRLVGVHWALGKALSATGDRAGALAAFRKAIELDPKSIKGHLWLGQTLLAGNRKEDLEEAVAAYSKAIELNPHHNGAWYNRGAAYQRLGLPDRALTDYSRAIALVPTHSYALSGRADIYAQRGQWDKAAADYSQIIRAHPNNAAAWYGRGRCRRNLGQLEQALADLSRAIELQPKLAAALSSRGAIQERLGRFREARADYEEALRHSAPARSAVHCNELAWLLATCPRPEFRDPNRAVELAKKAVALAPRAGNCWNTLGVAHYRAGQEKEAIAALTRSMELRNGGDAFDRLFLAMAHRKRGNPEEARKWYDQAVEWQEKNKEPLANDKLHTEELRRFRSEAEEVLELKK